MTNNAARSRRARRELLRCIDTAYRNSHDSTRLHWSVAEAALRNARGHAAELAKIAVSAERPEWLAMADALKVEDIIVAAERLTEIGYEPAAGKLERLWECTCGSTFHSATDLDEHIEMLEWWNIDGHNVSAGAARAKV